MEDSTSPFLKLPNELISEILTSLPVKTLLKSKCVCKSWRALISSQQFVAAHLENSKSNPKFTTLRLLMQFEGNFKQILANSLLYEPISEAIDLSSPFEPSSSREVVGSCNGLLCLSSETHWSFVGDYRGYFHRELHLWNPSTRICKELPNFGPSRITNYGFGYDKSSDDYKVVRFFRGDKNLCESEVMLQVYSLRNNRWKTVKSCVKPYWEAADPAVFANGKLYWIGNRGHSRTRDSCVVCFDLESEECEILRFPRCVMSGYAKWLGVCGGLLMVMCFHGSDSHVWILDGCGDGDGDWVKLVTIPKIEGYFWCPELVLCVMNSPVLFLCGGTVAVFDRKDCSIRFHEIRNTDGFRVYGTYIESLVSPLGWMNEGASMSLSDDFQWWDDGDCM